MKIELYELAIEVTRRCNMMCAHCLRGNAQNMDIKNETIDNALRDVERIGNIVFTGGEPTLNVPAIRYTLDVCKQNHIQVGSIYLVTNGKVITDDFLCAMIEWYTYCMSCDNFEDDLFGLALSQDMYHEGIDNENLAKLRAFSFFWETDKKVDFTRTPLVNEGRATELGDTNRYEINYDDDFVIYAPPHEDYIEIPDNILYLAANGNVKTDCNLAYDNDDLTIGNVLEEELISILLNFASDDDA